MIRKIASQYNANDLEQEIQDFWDENEVYRRTREARRGGKKFFFVDGPPYTTGRIHLGTAWNKAIKDTVLRYKSMNDYDILDRAGWDMHGLPIEVKVESKLGFETKKDIEDYGVANFIEECKQFALGHKDEMTEQFQDLGVWLNWEDPYMTVKNEYIEAAWWTLKQASEKDLLEQGLRVVNWCPRCETAIADAEVEYWDETDPSIYVKFKLKDKDEYLVVWTTTPWTIPSNVAAAVHPSFEYARVRATKDGQTETLIMAEPLVEDVLRKGRYQDYEVLERVLGEELAGIEYVHPLASHIPAQAEMTHKIYLAEFVTAENTGIVHIAPGHGPEDFELGQEYGLEVFSPVDYDGKFKELAGDYEGVYVKDADPMVIEDLKEDNLLLSEERITHRYGHCWRCKTPIIFLATVQWFVKVKQLKDRMLEEIGKVDWYPDWAGSARFKDWVSGARDWCISRQRYWGIPIPVWECQECEDRVVVGTEQELKRLAGLDGDIELHRPYVDEIIIPCECGGEKHRVEDIFDVWFDSAVASWATLRYPREQECFEDWWPSDWITEGHDQTRGWFYSQLGASMVAFDRAPYDSVLMHGFTLDAEGRKMSKSLGNVVEPGEVINKYGADTFRFYVLGSNAPWEDLKFGWDEVANKHRALNILWNVYRFPLPYMQLDEFDPTQISLESVKQDLREEDRWILSLSQTLIKKVDRAMSTYELHRAVRAIEEFVLEDLSRWYVQLVRPRTWTEESDDPDKLAAYRVMYDVLVTLARVMAPFTPHVSESIYQNLVRNVDEGAPVSIHMTDWPTPQESLIDHALEEHMSTARGVVEASANARQKVDRKLRWPVQRIVVEPEDEGTIAALEALEGVVLEQTNSKSLVVLEPGESWDELLVEVVPQPSEIGPEFKGDAGRVMAALKEINGRELRRDVLGGLDIEVAGDTYHISEDMVEFRYEVPEWAAKAEFNGGTVYVDGRLTPELESEGYAREIIRRIQDMRKDLDLKVEEMIRVGLRIDDSRVEDLIQDWREFICEETRATTLDADPADGDLVKDWDVEDVSMRISVTRGG